MLTLLVTIVQYRFADSLRVLTASSPPSDGCSLAELSPLTLVLPLECLLGPCLVLLHGCVIHLCQYRVLCSALRLQHLSGVSLELPLELWRISTGTL